MNYSPKISIITPSLNQGQFIEKTIRSVLSQDYPNLEYIVMDGGSSDNTLSILNSYSDRLKWISEKDNGQTQAINKGLRLADGEIVAYLNADDLLLPGALSRVAWLFIEMPEAMWVTGQCRIIDEENREIRGLIAAYKNAWLRFRSRPSLLITDYISQPSTFWRASVLSELGYLDESLHYAMDYEYWLRLYSKYSLVFIPEYLAAFRIHTQSKNTNAGHTKVYINEEKAIIRKHTRSSFLRTLHDVHRWIMTTVYSLITRAQK
jgi:glycosyltransferase involved in cell wall biosynthesis